MLQTAAQHVRLPDDNAGMGAFLPFIGACRILKWAQQAQTPVSSFFPADPLREDAAKFLEWRYLPLIRGDDLSRSEREADLSVAELVERNAAWVRHDPRERALVIGMYDDYDMSLARSYGTTLRLIARGDIDGDGIEDLVVWYAKGFIETEHLGIKRNDDHGTMAWSEYRILTRTSPTERYREICPPEQDDEQKALEALWLQFAGPRCGRKSALQRSYRPLAAE